jgi:ribosomal protein S18 acetylase RimI-like enzyme
MSAPLIGPEDIEAIERATAAAVGVQRSREIGGWLLSMDPGPIHRAASAVPLRHDLPASEATLAAIEAAYREAGMSPAMRVPEVQGLDPIRDALLRRGYEPSSPTLLMVGKPAGLRALAVVPCDLAERPDAAWLAGFTGEGFDPEDGAIRAAALSRSPDTMFGAVREGSTVTAVGAVAFGFGWASINGMRTVRSWRGKGLAGRVLAGLAVAAEARGLQKIYLVVEEPNHSARGLYERAGFETAWRYNYFTGPT